MTLAERKTTLEAKFGEVFLEKARHDESARRCHDELMRLQGAITLLEALIAEASADA